MINIQLWKKERTDLIMKNGISEKVTTIHIHHLYRRFISSSRSIFYLYENTEKKEKTRKS